MKNQSLLAFAVTLMFAAVPALADSDLRMTQDDIHVAGPVTAFSQTLLPQNIEPAAGGPLSGVSDLRMTQNDVHEPLPANSIVAQQAAAVAPQNIEPAAGGDNNLRMTFDDIHHIGAQ
jgi:hypothetical protein